MAEKNDTSEDIREIGLASARQGSIFLGGEIATSIITLIMLIFLARILKPADFGLYSIAISFAAILYVAQTFGISTAYRKMLPAFPKESKTRASQLISAGFRIAMPIGIAITIAGMLASGLIARYVYGNPALSAVLIIAALSEFLAVALNLALGALVGLGRVKWALFTNVTYSAAYLAASVALVLLGYGVLGAVTGMLLGTIAGAVIGILYMLIALNFNVAKPHKEDIRSLSSFSTPIVVYNVASQGSLNLAVLVLGAFAISSVVGNYGAAYKLARFVELSITAITFILVGTFSRTLSKKETAEGIGTVYNNSLYYTAIMLFPIVAYGMANAVPLTRLLFSSAYATAPFYFAIMIFGLTVEFIGMYAGTLMIGSGDTKKFMEYQLIAIAVQVALVLVLTPLYKAIGVLVALFVITPIVLDIIYIKALKSQFRITHPFNKLARITAAALIVGALFFGVTTIMNHRLLSLAANAVLLVVVFPPVLAVLGGISRKNLEFIETAAMRLKQAHAIVRVFTRYTSRFVKE